MDLDIIKAMKITILGSGTSHGIPVVGCDCPVCTSGDSRDKRMRSSVYIEGAGGEAALIDAGPEFRLQAVRAGIHRLDGILLTHSHADHIHGLDDVRPLSRDNPIPVYGNEQTIKEMKERFSYIWGETQRGGGKPKLTPLVVDGPVQIGGLVFTPVPVKHGILDILGWEVRDNIASENTGKCFLYLTDTSAIPPDSFRYLNRGDSTQSRLIVIGGLRMWPHETHFSFVEALSVALILGAGAVYLTHICHSHSHEEIEEFCQNFKENRRASVEGTSVPNIEEIEIHPAQDGLEINL